MRFSFYVLFIILIAPLALFDIALFFQIPLLLQFLGFILICMIPGIAILYFGKIASTTFTEMFVYAWGLSLSFILFFGILINTIFPFLGISSPLTSDWILISYHILYLLTIATVCFPCISVDLYSIGILERILSFISTTVRQFKTINNVEKILLLLPLFFPVICIAGLSYMNSTGNNSLILIFILLVVLQMLLSTIFNEKLSGKYYTLCILLISISLVLLLALRSNSILGADIHQEFQFFQMTAQQGYWQISDPPQLIDSCLSISILPLIINTFIRIEPILLYKLLFSVIFSIVPVVIYLIAKKYVGEFYGFLASMFFMSQSIFLAIGYQPRTSIAILFFAFFVLTLTRDGLDAHRKRAILIIFFTSCVLSHYSTTYIVLFLAVGTFLCLEVFSLKNKIEKKMNWMLIAVFFSIIFLWYNLITIRNFQSGIGFMWRSLTETQNFLIVESRTESTAGLFGVGLSSKAIPSQLEFILTWIIFASIGIGILYLVYCITRSFFNKNSGSASINYDLHYSVLAIVSCTLLVVTVTLPRVIPGYSMGRVWLLICCVLSVIFVIGVVFSIGLVARVWDLLKGHTQLKDFLSIQSWDLVNTSDDRKKKRISWSQKYFAVGIIIIYFLSTSGFTYQISGNNKSIILNSDGFEYTKYYITDYDAASAQWMTKESIKKSTYGIFVLDPTSTDILGDLGIPLQVTNNFKKIDIPQLTSVPQSGYIYFRTFNTGGRYWNLIEGERYFNLVKFNAWYNTIYSNGGSIVQFNH